LIRVKRVLATRAIAALALTILTAAAGPAHGAGTDPRWPAEALGNLETEQTGLFTRVAPSVLLLVRDGASGSGFVVGRGGLVLTNAHVVGEGDEVAVQTADGRFGRGRVIARATGPLDLALVRVPFDDLPALVAGDSTALRPGTFAATVGHGGGAAWTLSTGLVANPRPLGDGAPVILAQMALRPGSSGGPLVDRLGRVIAVVTAGTRDASGVTFAIRIDAAVAAFPQLAGLGTRPSEPPSTAAVARVAPDPGRADVGPEPRAVEVASLSRPVLPAAPAAMVTVWEAPRPARRVAARVHPAPVREVDAGASAVARNEPTPAVLPALPVAPQGPWPGAALLAMALLAMALLAGGVAGRVSSRRGPVYPPAKQ
jgi:S1-C subfamily serine protease